MNKLMPNKIKKIEVLEWQCTNPKCGCANWHDGKLVNGMILECFNCRTKHEVAYLGLNEEGEHEY